MSALRDCDRHIPIFFDLLVICMTQKKTITSPDSWSETSPRKRQKTGPNTSTVKHPTTHSNVMMCYYTRFFLRRAGSMLGLGGERQRDKMVVESMKATVDKEGVTERTQNNGQPTEKSRRFRIRNQKQLNSQQFWCSIKSVRKLDQANASKFFLVPVNLLENRRRVNAWRSF